MFSVAVSLTSSIVSLISSSTISLSVSFKFLLTTSSLLSTPKTSSVKAVSITLLISLSLVNESIISVVSTRSVTSFKISTTSLIASSTFLSISLVTIELVTFKFSLILKLSLPSLATTSFSALPLFLGATDIKFLLYLVTPLTPGAVND